MPDAGMANYQASRHQRIIAACEKWWLLTGPHDLPNKEDCSGFVASVAGELGIDLHGSANDIYLEVQRKPWSTLGTGEAAATLAAIAATNGRFVVAAWQAPPGKHGHVAVIVNSNQYHKVRAFQGRAMAYWGTLGSVGQRYSMHTNAFGAEKLPRVIYASHELSSS
jgi:hypothetical protein